MVSAVCIIDFLSLPTSFVDTTNSAGKLLGPRRQLLPTPLGERVGKGTTKLSLSYSIKVMFILHYLYEVYFFGGRGAKDESEGIDCGNIKKET